MPAGEMIEEKSEEDGDKEEPEEGDEKEESEEDDEKDKKDEKDEEDEEDERDEEDEINASLTAPGLRADRFEKKRKGPCPGPAWRRSSLETLWFAKSKREIERGVFHKRRSKGGWDRRLRKEGKGRGKWKR